MSYQLRITRVPGVPTMLVGEEQPAVVDIPNCPHGDCHFQFAKAVAMLDFLDATYTDQEAPEDEPEEGTDDWKSLQSGEHLIGGLPLLVDIKRRGVDLDDWERQAEKVLRTTNIGTLSNGAALIISPFSVN